METQILMDQKFYVHDKPIKDISQNSKGDEFVTVSSDGTMKITDLRFPHPVVTWQSDHPLRSVVWSHVNDYEIVFGSQYGAISTYDMRNTNISTVLQNELRYPVFRVHEVKEGCFRGVLFLRGEVTGIATLDGPSQTIQLNFSGHVKDIGYDMCTSSIISTAKSNDGVPFHSIFRLDVDQTEVAPSCRPSPKILSTFPVSAASSKIVHCIIQSKTYILIASPSSFQCVLQETELETPRSIVFQRPQKGLYAAVNGPNDVVRLWTADKPKPSYSLIPTTAGSTDFTRLELHDKTFFAAANLTGVELFEELAPPPTR
jgi:hypothetical protein